MKKHSPEWRMMVLKEAQQLGNIAATCEKFEMDRTTFYKLKKRCGLLPEGEWPAALQNHRRRWKTHGQQTSKPNRRVIKELALAHPAWGCNRLEAELREIDISRSHNTIQKILNSENIGTRSDRWSALDQLDVEHSEEQIEFIEKFNPCYRDRASRKATPGALLFVDAIKAGPFDGLGERIIYVAIDSCSSYASCSIFRSLTAENAIWLLENRAIPSLGNKGHRVQAVSTLSARAFEPLFSTFLTKRKINRHSGKGAGRGFIERFKAIVEKEFVLGPLCNRKYNDIKELRAAFKDWLRSYNKAPLDGFPNFGQSPMSMLGKATD